MRYSKIELVENDIVKEATIIHITKAKDEDKYFVFDECGEGIQADGDDVLKVFDTFEEAKEFAEQVTQEYCQTYNNITTARVER